MSRYLPSFLKRAAAPSETTPLVQQDDAAAEEGNIRADRDGKEDEKEDETPPEQGDIHAFGDFVRTRQAVTMIPGAELALQLCLGVLILLAAAFVIWTIITLCTTSHVLSSPCAKASPIWAYLISALAFLLLEPIFSHVWDGVIGCLGILFNLCGRTAEQIKKNDEFLWRAKAQFKTCDALAHVLLSIWGLVIWTNLRCSLCCLVSTLVQPDAWRKALAPKLRSP